MLYNQSVIKNFLHKGIERFFLSGSKAGIQPQHAKRLRLQLERLHRAATPQDMRSKETLQVTGPFGLTGVGD